MELQIKNNKIFAPLKNKELVLTPEERVRQEEYICRLVNHYGYELAQMEQELQVNNSHRGQGKARADIVVWKSASAKSNEDAATIVVECKAEHITIREEDYFQGYNYAAWVGADFFVTTNKLVMTSDKTFTSPSAAADICIGSSNNDWLVWKDKDGNTLDPVYRKPLE